LKINNRESPYLTRELLSLCDPLPGGKWLDAGAGAGAATARLRERGFDAVGIDINVHSKLVVYGDMLKIPFPNNHFNAIVSECSLSICGDCEKALAEFQRVLIPGGDFFISDVKLYKLNYLKIIDATKKFKENYLRLLWEGVDLKKIWSCDFDGYFLTHGRT
jgi:ubiquinone/menaquinone biosynthesis C-methylase UbiE